MRGNITRKLRDFWDAGIRGPDFVWAATGPALEAFSKHPVVRKANQPGALMTVSEFLREVRRMVVDFVVGRVLTGGGDADAASGLDDVTTYYLLHRGDFGMDEAPAGACILYALSCNLSDRDLSDRFEILSRPAARCPTSPKTTRPAKRTPTAAPAAARRSSCPGPGARPNGSATRGRAGGRYRLSTARTG